MPKFSKFRIKAFLIHLAISLTISSIFGYLVFGVWHYAPLAKAVGVSHIFLMMLAIDTILGPTLTLIIADEKKISIKFDLLSIALIQLIALSYGIYSIAINRPVFIAFDVFRFELVQANDIEKENKNELVHDYQRLGLGYPKYVSVRPVANEQEKLQRLLKEMQMGLAPTMRPSLYEPLSNQFPTIIAKSQTLSKLYQFNDKQSVDEVLKNYPTATAFIPLKAYEVDMTVLIDSKEEKIVTIVDLRPWK